MTSGCGQDAMREQCRLVALGAVLRTFGAPGVFGVAGRRIYTASASGDAARVHDPFGIPSGLATLSVHIVPRTGLAQTCKRTETLQRPPNGQPIN